LGILFAAPRNFTIIQKLKNTIMNNTDNFSPKGMQKKSTTINYKNIVIGVLAVGIILLGGYLLVDKNKSTKVIHQQATQITKVNEEKSDIQKSFDASLARLDSMSTVNASLGTKLSERNGEIAKVKLAIRSILNKRTASASELSKAKLLIASLNGKIESLQAEVVRLAKENDNLSNEKALLTMEKERLTTELSSTTNVKQELEKKVDIAATLNASNIQITPVNIKKNGKEKISTVAKRIDKLVISFDVDNRIATAGTTDVYVLVIDPDGKALAADGQGPGTFNTRMEGYKSFTAKVPVEVETAKKKNVEFAFKPDTNFQEGNYTIQIYQNGFMIGEGIQSLKKGGLFS
jgi:peptidoglycan hydrolase CwlO-like protein